MYAERRVAKLKDRPTHTNRLIQECNNLGRAAVNTKTINTLEKRFD